MAETPTIRDVAKRAGVSLGTASQALNNKPGVASETRARVLEAAAALGYQQQVRVPSPITNQLAVIGLVTRREANESPTLNPFYSQVLAGAERECQRQNLSLMYANIQTDAYKHAGAWPPMLLDNRVDGVLVVGVFLEDTVVQINRHVSKPMVLVDAYTTGQLFDSIVTNNLYGSYNAVSYLIEQGHRRIGLIGSGPGAYPSILERREGYLRALQEHDIKDLYIEESTLNREAAYGATCTLLQRSPEITAIFGCNDDVAIGAINAAHDLGLHVPHDLSVVGFDDIDLAREITPALTTVYVDKVLMGMLAVRHLRDRAENPDWPTLTTSLSTQLIIRDSVRKLNAG